MLRLASVVATLVLILTLLTGTGEARSRIEWETGVPSILFQHVSAEGFFGADRDAHETYLLVELHGRLRSLAYADTALYAVFLDDRDDVATLSDALLEFGSPMHWGEGHDHFGDAAAYPAPFERIRIEANGAVTIHAHEGRLLGRDYVAVVNGAGEILGCRPVWAEPDDSIELP